MAKKKKAAKSSKKKTTTKKAAKKAAIKTAPKGPSRYTADLQSIRTAIERVQAHVKTGHKHAEKRAAAGGPSAERAAQILQKLGEAHAMMAAECCNLDQNCDF